jgi:hypothetical protein
MSESAHPRNSGRARALRMSAPVAVVGGLASAAIALAVVNPYANQVFPPCALHQLTGLYCPGCGGTRAAFDLTQGDVASAMHMNAFTTVIVLPGAIFLLGWWLASAAGLRVPPVRIPTWAVWLVLGALIVFTVVRNLPPFAPYLAP